MYSDVLNGQDAIALIVQAAASVNYILEKLPWIMCSLVWHSETGALKNRAGSNGTAGTALRSWL